MSMKKVTTISSFTLVLGIWALKFANTIKNKHVSNEMNVWLPAFPLFIKQIAMRQVYNASAKANTTTVTNLGVLGTKDPYTEYIERFQAVLSMSKGQNIKMTVISFKDTMTLTFSSRLQERDLQRMFFRKLSEDNVDVTVETNGLYYN